MRFQGFNELRIIDLDGAEIIRRAAELLQLIDLLGRENPPEIQGGELAGDVVGPDHDVGHLAGFDELLELGVGDLSRFLLHQVGVHQQDQDHRADEVPE